MSRGLAGGLAFVFLLVGSGNALGSSGYKSPERLKQLARLDASLEFVTAQHWRKRVSVARWRREPTIVVARSASLQEVARAAPLLVVHRHRVWELRAPLFVVQGATLTLSAPAVSELRLISYRRSFATIVADDSNVRVRGMPAHRLVVRSWVSRAKWPDLNLANGRGSISVRGSGRLYASYASFSYLGFTLGRASGVSINGSGPGTKGSGRVDHSTFSHNVFGAYTWEAQKMRWTRNRFTHNLVYGFDPHDASNWLVVDHNYAADNGRHGIICSRACKHDVIRDNVSVRNGWDGIVVDAGRAGKTAPSADNTVVGNTVRHNAKVGISIGGSNHILIRRNQVDGGRIGIRVFGRRFGKALGNRLVENRILHAQEIGVLVQEPAQSSLIAANTIEGGPVGIVVRRASRTAIVGSTVRDVDRHAISVVGATGTRMAQNQLSGAGPSAIQTIRDTDTTSSGNDSDWNYPLVHDLARVIGWFVAPGLWLSLFLVVLVTPLLIQVSGLFRRGMCHLSARSTPRTSMPASGASATILFTSRRRV